MNDFLNIESSSFVHLWWSMMINPSLVHHVLTDGYFVLTGANRTSLMGASAPTWETWYCDSIIKKRWKFGTMYIKFVIFYLILQICNERGPLSWFREVCGQNKFNFWQIIKDLLVPRIPQKLAAWPWYLESTFCHSKSRIFTNVVLETWLGIKDLWKKIGCNCLCQWHWHNSCNALMKIIYVSAFKET